MQYTRWLIRQRYWGIQKVDCSVQRFKCHCGHIHPLSLYVGGHCGLGGCGSEEPAGQGHQWKLLASFAAQLSGPLSGGEGKAVLPRPLSWNWGTVCGCWGQNLPLSREISLCNFSLCGKQANLSAPSDPSHVSFSFWFCSTYLFKVMKITTLTKM